MFALQDLLRVGNLDPQIGSDQIGQPAGLVDAVQHGHDVRGGGTAQGQNTFALFLGGAHHGFLFQGQFGNFLFLDQADAGFHIGFGLDEILHTRPADALDKHLEFAVRHLEHPHDHGHRAHAVQILGRGIIHAFVLLRQDQNIAMRSEGASTASTDLSRPTNRGRIM